MRELGGTGSRSGRPRRPRMALRHALVSSALTVASLAAACGGGERDSPPGEGDDEPRIRTREVEMSLQVTSDAFSQGSEIPTRHTCDGADVSPLLRISGAPEETESLAVVADDPDAPGTTWVHWVIYDIPPDATELPEDIPAEGQVVDGARQGQNDFGNLGYGGPCPPPGGAHRYFFKVYALDARLGLPAGATKEELLEAMEGHVAAEGELVGTYRRS